MFETLPADIQTFMRWEWAQIEPFVTNLQNRPLNATTLAGWLEDYNALGSRIDEAFSRLNVATTVNTADAEAEARLTSFLETILPQVQLAADAFNRKLLAAVDEQGLTLPDGFAVPLRNMRADVELFRPENVPLFTDLGKLGIEFDKLTGAMTVQWQGEELTLPQLGPILQGADRAQREQAWRLKSARFLQDRAALNDQWREFLKLRVQVAKNAGMPDFRAYQWQALHRFDYTPEDAVRFQDAIAEVVVPAAARVYERRRRELGVDVLRPWDGDSFTRAEAPGFQPLQPFSAAAQLVSTSERIFQQVDPQLGDYFSTMARESLLDLDSRKNKAPGGYCTTFSYSKRPFIFMNAVGLHDDVQTLLHEAGHAFHAFEAVRLPYLDQQNAPTEFCEVASMAMELIAAPYLAQSHGGFYSAADTARARAEHLENLLLFWPYMAVVDAFQHWVYTHADDALNPDNCDAQWSRLWDRFIVGPDWSGFQAEKETGWHRKLHIFQVPFYYIEYGLAQLGAVQVWANSLNDQAGAVAAYRRGLALGGTATLPELFAAAGARFALDAATLRTAVELVESTLDTLTA